MGLLDNAELLKGLVKPYLPKITRDFLPKVNNELVAALYKEDENLQDGEKETVFMISRDGENAYLRTVQLDENAHVVRSSDKRKVSSYLESIINQAFK